MSPLSQNGRFVGVSSERWLFLGAFFDGEVVRRGHGFAGEVSRKQPPNHDYSPHQTEDDAAIVLQSIGLAGTGGVGHVKYTQARNVEHPLPAV